MNMNNEDYPEIVKQFFCIAITKLKEDECINCLIKDDISEIEYQIFENPIPEINPKMNNVFPLCRAGGIYNGFVTGLSLEPLQLSQTEGDIQRNSCNNRDFILYSENSKIQEAALLLFENTIILLNNVENKKQFIENIISDDSVDSMITGIELQFFKGGE